MKRALLFTLFLLVVTVSVGRALPQQKPTYEQTRDWIVTKISEEAGSTHPNPSLGNETESYEDVSMNSCKLQFTHSVYDSFLKTTNVDVQTVPMDKVKSVSVKHLTFEKIIDSYYVEMLTAPKAVSEKRTKKSADGNIVDQNVLNADSAAIVFGRPKAENETMAGRMQKALNRAAELCSASPTKEPF